MSAAMSSPLAIESELPEGWAGAQLCDGIVLDVRPGFACGKNNRAGEGIGHIRPMNVSVEGRIDLSDLKFVPISEVDRDERLLSVGDVVFNNTNSHELVGKTAFYNLSQSLAFSNHMTRIRCRDDALDPSYCAWVLHYLWQTGYFQNICNDHVSQSSVGREVLSDTVVPLPPLAEQKRIIERVEQLLGRVKPARERLARVPAILKRFRQAVLAAACSGRLTADWRESQGGSDCGAELLETILEERRRTWEHLRKRSRTSPKYVGPQPPSFVILPDLPESWVWTSVEAILRYPGGLSYGILKPGKPDPKGIPMLRVMDIGDWDFNRTEIARVSPKLAAQYGRTRLESGDILLAVMATIGRVAVVPDRFVGANVNRALAVLKISRRVKSEFAAIALRSPFFQDTFASEKLGSAQARINLSDLRGFCFPIPPEREQGEIVRRIEALFKLADAIEKRVAAATMRAEKLTQAILAKAFRGELVPTEAELARREGRDYEPASALLARIRAEHESNGTTPREKLRPRKITRTTRRSSSKS
jgi:type I restriction enzyme, S subunit